MKLKKINKLLSIMLSAAMCLTVCACGQEEQTASQPSNSTSAVEESTNTNESQSEEPKMYWEMLDEVSDTSELPDWTGDTLEVNLWYAGGTDASLGEISDTNVTFKELERVTGVRFVTDGSITNGGDNIDAMMPRLVASDTMPTLVYGWDINTQLNELYKNGYLADLSEYYANGDLDHVLQWIPMEEFNTLVYEGITADDGAIFAIPASLSAIDKYDSFGYVPEGYDPQFYALYAASQRTAAGLYATQWLYVRDDILKALYPDAHTNAELQEIYMKEDSFTAEQIFDIPLDSTEDFVDFLYDIKELLADGEYVGLDGSNVEVTFGPHTGTDNWAWMQVLPKLVAGFGAGTDYFSYVDFSAEDESSVMKRSIDSEEYAEWMKTLNALVNDDVIAQNSLVDNGASFEEKYLNGHYAVLYGQVSSTVAAKIDGSEGGWSYRPVWVNVPISETFGGAVTGGNFSTHYAINSKNLSEEELDQLVHCIDYLNSRVGINNFHWGPESAGLFTEDAEGNRSYVDEVYACMLGGEDTDVAYEYGLFKSGGTKRTFATIGMSEVGRKLYSPSYLISDEIEKNPENAYNYYHPGILPGMTYNENVVSIAVDKNIYGSGMVLESAKEFWGSRSGFENEIKKVIAAKTDDFEKEYNNLIDYADSINLDAETIQEFNDLFVEKNRKQLEEAGIIK